MNPIFKLNNTPPTNQAVSVPLGMNDGLDKQLKLRLPASGSSESLFADQEHNDQDV